MLDQVNFYTLQPSTSQSMYITLLSAIGSLSNLYADTNEPFIHYRAMENIFCKAFDAQNLSRGDLSVDASKDRMGIGLKTFLHNNGKTFQKIAEFNKESYLIDRFNSAEKKIQQVAQMRNNRLLVTQRACQLQQMIYHVLTRSQNMFMIYEEPMDLIDLEAIQLEKDKSNTIHFTDGKHEYNFSLSKHTLLKRFYTHENKCILKFHVNILQDPYQLLLSLCEKFNTENTEIDSQDERQSIVLPLYSPRDNTVPERSGLNMWNAAGRARHPDEVYIVIPAWIHTTFPDFFQYSTADHKTDPFEVLLPNGRQMSMKVAQQGGKALMSNPNCDLGQWILREVLDIPEKQLVTKEMLDMIGIDSVKLTKIRDRQYRLDFLTSGRYTQFLQHYHPTDTE